MRSTYEFLLTSYFAALLSSCIEGIEIAVSPNKQLPRVVLCFRRQVITEACFSAPSDQTPDVLSGTSALLQVDL
jgi:hypothetical protein